MGEREAIIKIKAKNEADSGVASAVASLKSLNNAAEEVSKVISTLGKITVFGALGTSVKEVGEKVLALANDFGEVQRTTTQLTTALGGNQTSFTRMSELIETMSSKTLASKSDIESLVAELASLGKSDSEIENITQASVALSNVTGGDLNSAFTMLNSSYAGSAEKLKKLLPEVGELTASQLESGAAIDIVNRKFGIVSDSMAGGWSQAVHNFGNAFGDIKETLGESLANGLQPFVVTCTKFFEYLASNKEVLIGVISGIDIAFDAVLFAINPIIGTIATVATGIASLSALAGNFKILWMEIEVIIYSVAKAIQDAVSWLGNQFVSVFNGILEAYNKLASTLKAKPIELIGSIDIAKAVGLDDSIASINAAIQEEKAKLAQTSASAVTSTRSSRSSDKKDAWAEAVSKSSGDSYSNVDFEAYAAALNASLTAQEKYEKSILGITDETAQLMLYYQSEAYQQEQARLNTGGTTSYSSGQDSGLTGSWLDNFGTNLRLTLENALAKLTTSDTSASTVVSTASASLVSTATSDTGNMGSLLSSIVQYGGPLGVILWSLEKVFSGIIEVVEPLVNNILDPLAGMLEIVGTLIGSLLAPALELLEPIIELIGELFVWVYNSLIVPAYNYINEAFNSIYNGFVYFLNGLIDLINSAISWTGYSIGEVSSRSTTAGNLSTISYSDLTEEGSESSSSSSGSSASYSGPSTINITNYLYGTFVSEDEFDTHITSVVKESLAEYETLGY